MKTIRIPSSEEPHLIRWRRAEDTLVGSLQNLFFHLQYLGDYTCRSSFRIRRRHLDSVLLLLTLEGEGRLRCLDKEYRLTPGTLMLLSPRCPHEYWAVGEGWRIQYLHFSGAMSQEYQEYIQSRFGPVFPLHRKIYLELLESLDTLFRLTERDATPDYAVISTIIYSMLTSLLSVQHPADASQKSTAAIRQAADFIAENYDSPISTQQIADEVHLSRSYMSELFTKFYGMSPHEYLTRYRLSQARDLLRNTELSVSEIAEACGFRDVFTFSRVFRSKYGYSPTQFRKRSG